MQSCTMLTLLTAHRVRHGFNAMLQAHEKSNVNASHDDNDIPRRRADFQNETSMVPPPDDAASCAYCPATGHYLDGCTNFSALNMDTKRRFITDER